MTAQHNPQDLSYDDKLRLTNRDARWALGALAFVVVVWLACGFGLAGFDIKVFHVPLWVVCGLLGTWVAAMFASVVLSRVFRNFDLEDEIEVSYEPDEYRPPALTAAASGASAAPAHALMPSESASSVAAASAASDSPAEPVKVVTAPEIISVPAVHAAPETSAVAPAAAEALAAVEVSAAAVAPDADAPAAPAASEASAAPAASEEGGAR